MTRAGRELEGWLASIGLERYARTLRDNDVDLEVLPELTEADLEQLGLSLGHRKKLLRALAGSAVAVETSPPDTPSPRAQARPGATGEGERRQLTVMFIDLVGSTELSRALDPEDMADVIRRYQACCADVLKRWDGHVAKYMGDGVMAYFGFPSAHEDDAERAVRAGLDLIQAVGALQCASGLRLAVRIAAATGQVMVGELIGHGSAQEETVVGETPNLAARLQTLAPPNGVVIAEGTRRLIGRLFDLEDLGRQELKGFESTTQAWLVAGLGRAESRFDALRGGQLTPLVGRDHELAILLERWSWASDGDGQVVLLSGEPGIGKSRLIRGIRERLTGDKHVVVSHYCSPYHGNTALHPVIELIERAARFERDDSSDRRLDRLEQLLENPSDAVPLVAALMSIPTGERYPSLQLSPQRQKQRTLEVLMEQLESLAAGQPVLAIYEDLQWADPSTIAYLDLVTERVQGLPVLVIFSFRSEFTPPWRGSSHMTTLTLNRLGRRHGAAFIQQLTGKPIPADVVDQIVAKTEGVPLFVEELTKTVLESQILTDAGDRYAIAGTLPPLAIPATLNDSLTARLDRLSSVKEVAQIGAVIGRHFSHDLLAAVVPLSDEELKQALDQLVASELIFRRGIEPSVVYGFKHALVRDAAYEGLLKSRRQVLHARIVDALEGGGVEGAEPEILAHHSAQAGFVEKSARYWQKSGDLAISRSATLEAISDYRAALDLVGTLPKSAEGQRQELALQTSLGASLIAARGLAAPEVAAAFARADDLCREVDDRQLLIQALCGQYFFNSQRGDLGRTRALAERVLELARQGDDPGPLIIGHRIVGTSLLHLGLFHEARPHLERVLVLFAPERHRSLARRYSFDPNVLSLHFLSWCLQAQGHVAEAKLRSQESLADAQKAGHPASIAHAVAGAAILAQLRGEREAVRAQAEALLTVSDEQSFPFWAASGTVLKGWSEAANGQTDQGIALIEDGLSAYRATGAELWSPYFLLLLGEARRMAGQGQTSLAATDEALAQVYRSGARWCEADLYTLKGQLAADAGHFDQAGVALESALRIAREQSARSFELRAATGLARLWAEQGEAERARDLLNPMLAWFDPGSTALDLDAARSLLRKLG